jgi:hypothetical protein
VEGQGAAGGEGAGGADGGSGRTKLRGAGFDPPSAATRAETIASSCAFVFPPIFSTQSAAFSAVIHFATAAKPHKCVRPARSASSTIGARWLRRATRIRFAAMLSENPK